jgi:hypothetical protein
MSAASHHEQAAHFHREAARHYQVGKDYAQAAHQALTAHGHELRALEHGQSASEVYARHEGSPLPGYLTRSPDKPQSTAVAAHLSLSGAAHHVAAGQHHAQAETHCSAEHYIRANHETQKALGHGKHAIFHADQAALRHMEQYGHHPAAELV